MSERFIDRVTAVGETAFLRGDPRVPDGAHWRISIPSDAVPAGPVAVFGFNLTPDPAEGIQHGGAHDQDFDDVEPGCPLLVSVADPAPDWIIAWALVEAEGELRIAVIDPVAAPNGEYAEIAARTERPYAFAVADMQMIRATGSGRVHRVELFKVPRLAGEGLGDRVDVATLAAEAADQIAGYARAHEEEPWQKRVARSAPSLRLPYDPRGPDRPVDPDGDPDETARIEAARIETLVWADGSVAEWVRAAYGSLTDPLAAAISSTRDDGATVRYDAVAALHTACVDPGIARWLGLSGTFEDFPDLEERQMFFAAVPVYRLTRRGLLRLPLPPPVLGGRVAERYDELTGGGLTDAVALARGFASRFRLYHWTVSLLVVPLPAVLDAPPAAPAAPRPVTSRASWDASWDASVEPPAKQRWTHTIALDGAVPTGSVSLVTTAPDWQTHHSPDDGTDQVEANRMIAGWPRPSLKAKRNPVVSAVGVPVHPDPAVSDAVTFEVRLGDWVGRWSDPGTLNAGPPRRPAPPQPLVSAALVRADPVPTGTAPASPGTVPADLRVPPTTAPGSHPTSTVTVTSSHGHSEVVNLTPAEGRAGGRRRVTFAAPRTVPGQQVTVTVTARSADAAGTESGLGRCEVPVSDARPVRAPTLAPRLLVTTRRTNDATVSITLAITAQPNTAAYRFLMAAETLLWSEVPALPADVRELPRSERANRIIAAGAGERRHYMWAADEPPVAVDADRRASARIDLPSGTGDVVFVKAVPMAGTPTGKPPVESVSTPFAEIPPAAVVVPISDVPPIARLRLTSPGPGRITASVTLSGADRRVLKRLDGPLQARIVEVVDPDTSDPVFWPEVESIDLADEDDAFTGSVDVAATEWTRVCLAVAVRYPPEPTAMAGATVADPELRATGPQPERIASPWGPFSVPAWVDVAGAEPAIAPGGDPAVVSVEVSGLGELPAGQPPWVVSFLSGTGALTARTDVPVTPANPVAVLGARAADTRYAAQLVDPFGVPRPPLIL